MRKEPFILVDEVVDYFARSHHIPLSNASVILDQYVILSQDAYVEARFQQGLFPLFDAQVLDLWLRDKSHHRMKKAPDLGLSYRELSAANIITPQEYYLNFDGEMRWLPEQGLRLEELSGGVYVSLNSLAEMLDLSPSFAFRKAEKLGLQTRRLRRNNFYFIDDTTLEVLRGKNSYRAGQELEVSSPVKNAVMRINLYTLEPAEPSVRINLCGLSVRKDWKNSQKWPNGILKK